MIVNPNSSKSDTVASETNTIKSQLTQKELVELKMEAKKLQESPTFKPVIHTKQKSVSSVTESTNNNRFDKLYTEAMKRRLDSSVKPKDIPNSEELTFKPQISARANSRSKRAPSPMTVTDRLYSQSGAGRHSFDITKSLSTNPDSNKELTFKPQISKFAESVNRSQTKEISERLYEMSKEQTNKLNKLQENHIQNTLSQECTFTPKISASARSRSRSNSISRGVTSSSSQGLTTAMDTKDVTNRLLLYADTRQKKLELAKKHQLELESQSAPFKPHITPTKRSATPDRGGKVILNPGETIFDRLAKESLEKNQLMMSATNNTSPKSISQSTSAVKTTDGKIFERLAADANRDHMRAVLEKVKHDLELNGCTFKPEINSTSKLIVSNPHQNLDDILTTVTSPSSKQGGSGSNKNNNNSNNILGSENSNNDINEDNKLSTYTSDVNNSSSSKSANGTGAGTGVSIFDRLTAEAEKLKLDNESRQKIKQEEELKGLTFSPTINSKSMEMAKQRKSTSLSLLSTPAHTVTHNTADDSAAGTGHTTTTASMTSPKYSPKNDSKSNTVSTPAAAVHATTVTPHTTATATAASPSVRPPSPYKPAKSSSASTSTASTSKTPTRSTHTPRLSVTATAKTTADTNKPATSTAATDPDLAGSDSSAHEVSASAAPSSNVSLSSKNITTATSSSAKTNGNTSVPTPIPTLRGQGIRRPSDGSPLRGADSAAANATATVTAISATPQSTNKDIESIVNDILSAHEMSHTNFDDDDGNDDDDDDGDKNEEQQSESVDEVYY